uniref:Uncharacterized protein n=1 Tax=Cajanus cajan TaxID=3821 RepID=A0A151U180_CAJCA|nr:hypothetical protein KK1_005642 [Cajanus cajan]
MAEKTQKWRVIWCAIAWNIWNQRNACVFRHDQFVQQKLMKEIILTAWKWLRVKQNNFHIPFYLWSINPGLCI